VRPGLVCLRLNVVIESSAQQFEGFLNLGGLPFDAFLKIGLHLRRHIARFRRALLADFRVQDREAFEGRPEKAQRQKDFRWRDGGLRLAYAQQEQRSMLMFSLRQRASAE
jgi:hypothetical protein